jgi:hypothetical protein
LIARDDSERSDQAAGDAFSCAWFAMRALVLVDLEAAFGRLMRR